jgi:AcrR family transcriptional regulator
MSPEHRRAMIVAAALPLVVEHGANVTTAQVARAAGIGEGTIFRAFPDKDALLAACMAEALRLDDTLAHVRAIPLDQPLADRLVEAVEILRAYLTRMGAVAGALQATGGLKRERPPDGARQQALDATADALAVLLEPEQDRLRREPLELAVTLQYLAMAGAVPAADLVDLFLNGALRP